MSAINDTPARTPVVVITAHELYEHLRALEGESQDQSGGYSESFTWRKTDLSAGVGLAVAASRLILGGDVRALCGWAITESTGAAAAAVRLHDGGGAAGEQFARINLQASESVRDTFVPHGIRCFTGRIFMEVIAGSVEGVLYWR